MSGDKFLLDTNTVLYLLNGDETLAAFLFGKELCLSVISEIELLGYGKLSLREKNFIKKFISETEIIELNLKIKNYAIATREKYNTN